MFSLNIELGIKTNWLTILARYRDEVCVFVLQGLKQRLGRAPKRYVAARRRIVMRRNEDVGLVKVQVIEGLLGHERVKIIRRRCGKREVDAADTRHRRSLVIGNLAPAVPIHDPESVIERNEVRNGSFGDHAWIGCAAGLDDLLFGHLLRRRLRTQRVDGTLHGGGDFLRRLTVERQYRLDREILKI